MEISTWLSDQNNNGRFWSVIVTRDTAERKHGHIVTSAEEGGYVFSSVYLSVCLSVRRITRKLVNGF